MARPGDIGGIILDFAKSFVAMRQRDQELQLARERMQIEQQEAARGFELREQALQLRDQALTARQERDDLMEETRQLDIKLKEERLKGMQADAEKAGIKDQVGALNQAIQSNFQLARVLMGRGKEDKFSAFVAAITGKGPAPTGERPEDQKEVEAILGQTRDLIQRRNKLSGAVPGTELSVLPGDTLPTVVPPNPNQIGTPEAPNPSQSTLGPNTGPPGSAVQDSVMRHQEQLMAQINGLATEARQLEATTRNPEASPTDKQRSRERLRQINNDLQILKAELRGTATGGK